MRQVSWRFKEIIEQSQNERFQSVEIFSIFTHPSPEIGNFETGDLSFVKVMNDHAIFKGDMQVPFGEDIMIVGFDCKDDSRSYAFQYPRAHSYLLSTPKMFYDIKGIPLHIDYITNHDMYFDTPLKVRTEHEEKLQIFITSVHDNEVELVHTLKMEFHFSLPYCIYA